MMKILAGNWKMYKTREEVKSFFSSLELPSKASVRSIIAASPTLLETAVPLAKAKNVSIFSQNCAWAAEGAFTGEIAPRQLKELGVTGTLIGHSERRQYFGETTETCLKRIQNALAAGLEVIYCVGESRSERESGETMKVLNAQLVPVLGEIKAEDRKNFILAYEPVWAIGTGLVATTQQIEETHKGIQKTCASHGFTPPILYGGSVKPDNFGAIAAFPEVSGGLVGGASLDSKSFRALFDCL
jgi:triosephosphate isomerase